MRQRLNRGQLIGVLSAALAVTLLSGCGQLTPLPDKERYQYIDGALADLDYESAGQIKSFIKDNGDGVFAPSVKLAVYSNDDAYDTLADRLLSLPNADCGGNSGRQILCSYGQVTVHIAKSEDEVKLSLTDTLGGRSSE